MHPLGPTRHDPVFSTATGVGGNGAVGSILGCGSLEARRHLDRDSGSVAAARHWAADQARAWALDGIVDELQVVVSEMVTNAVLHAGTACTLTLRLAPLSLTVEVTDGSPEAPQLRTDREIGGRGLQLVTAFTSAWGFEPTATGKTVWARMDIGSERR